MTLQTKLKTAMISIGLVLSEAQLNQFEVYYHALQIWNEHINLTRIMKPDEVIQQHFLDSLSCLPGALDHGASKFALTDKTNFDIPIVIDIGTGAGFPSIPLKIVQPDIHLTLVESTVKKTNFLSHVVEALSLANVTILPLRAESVGQLPAHRERYHLALARAVDSLPVLAEYMLPLLTIGGKMMAWKGQNIHGEIESAMKAIHVLGGRYVRTIPVRLPNLRDTRHVVLVEKVAPSPIQYPRRAGMPRKKPILCTSSRNK